MVPPNPLFLPYVFSPNVLAIGIALPLICILIVGLRFFIRSLQKSKIGLDDWLAFASLWMVIGMGACFITGVKKHAMGYPTPPPPATLTPAEKLTFLDPTTEILQKIEFAFQHLMICEYALVKLSILYFYRRLFVVDNSGGFHILTILTIGIVILWFIAIEVLFTFACGRHLDAFWSNPLYHNSNEKFCQGELIFHTQEAMAVSDLALDLVIFFFPFPVIWKLHLTTIRKLAVSSVFIVGFMAIIASGLRLAYYEQILTREVTVTKENLVDYNLGVTLGHWWSFLEAGLSLIAACLPSLSYLFTKRSISSIVQTARSAISLRSLRSQVSGPKSGSKLQNGERLPYKKFDETGSSTDHSKMVPNHGSRVEPYAMGTVGEVKYSQDDDAIYVRKEFSQAENVA